MTTDDLKYSVKRSKRKTIGIRIEYDGSVTVLSPLNSSASELDRAVQGSAEWIRKKRRERQRIMLGRSTEPITENEILALKGKADGILPTRLELWATRLGVRYNKLTVRVMYSRWGSCSTDKNISLNCLLMLAPDVVIDYIIVHELSHIKHMDHSKAFYAFVDAHFPYRKECQRWLKEDGVLIINRARR